MRPFILLCIIVLLTDGCIDPLKMDVPNIDYQLVVDGFISNDPGPYTVKIYRSRPLKTDLDRLVAEKYAKVFLVDDLNNSELLKETEEGVYQTAVDGMQGEIGRSYHLEIEALGGLKLFSDPEEIKESGVVENVSFQFLDDGGIEKDKFQIFADAKGVNEKEDLIRFKLVSTYEVETFPQLRTIRTEGGERPYPFACSGYIERDGRLFKQTDCSCCQCWVNEYDDIPVVMNEQFNTDEFRGVNVGSVIVNRRTFYNKVRAEVQMLSLTDASYQFWKLVRTQKLGTTDLFQPPFAELKGNIHSSDPAHKPLGIFWAAGVARKSVYINKESIPYSLPPIDTVKAPCLFFQYSSADKPSFWE